MPGLYPGVDLLRAIAVSLVILRHFSFVSVGWVGVDLFFVISGFLIGGAILDKAIKGKFAMGEFYWRRALRILPLYYLIILLVALFRAPGSFDMMALKSVLMSMFFLQTTGPYFFPEILQINHAYDVGGSWSLVIEEMFYLVAPIALLVFLKITRGNLKAVAGLVALVVVSGIFARMAMTSEFAPDDANWHFASFVQFHSRYDELAAGVLAACLVRLLMGAKKQSVWWMVVGAFLLSVFLFFMYSHPVYLTVPQSMTRETIWLPTLLAAMCTAFLMGSYWWPIHFLPIVVIARLSYAIYLVHILLMELVGPHANEGVLLWLTQEITIHGMRVVLILFSLFFAYLASLLVEYPFVRLYKGRKEVSVRSVTNPLMTS